jgi:hypothetical protein
MFRVDSGTSGEVRWQRPPAPPSRPASSAPRPVDQLVASRRDWRGELGRSTATPAADPVRDIRPFDEVTHGMLIGFAGVARVFHDYPLGAPALLAGLATAVTLWPVVGTVVMWGGLALSATTVAKNVIESATARSRGDAPGYKQQLRELGESLFSFGVSVASLGINQGLALFERADGTQAVPRSVNDGLGSVASVVDDLVPLAGLMKRLRRAK